MAATTPSRIQTVVGEHLPSRPSTPPLVLLETTEQQHDGLSLSPPHTPSRPCGLLTSHLTSSLSLHLQANLQMLLPSVLPLPLRLLPVPPRGVEEDVQQTGGGD